MKTFQTRAVEAGIKHPARPSTGWTAFEAELRRSLALAPIGLLVAAVREGRGGSAGPSPADAAAVPYLEGCNIH
ncbi:hypothetical protein [Pelomonas sp. KK5]|uniref:hypothetical protein n=1 Tax=Pelomonas sp. KK5 TaxID=1855730 RepID=UPI00097BFBC5|nr:hypothetical protein [Pelomonas sp. KK5]